MDKKLNLSEAATETLKSTNDGKVLIPRDLKLVEDAVNGNLEDKGLEQFKSLLDCTRKGYLKTRAKAIASLNDELRTAFDLSKGRIVATVGFTALPEKDQFGLLGLVQNFNQFTKENDPHGEHDNGRVTCNGHKVFWKIDYYDNDLNYHSPDPADPSVTKRVMTIMLAYEY